ncbi:heat shock 22 kDa protein, mitochondrial-like isoform X2 [Aristolochia californica]|uniref:heat shock 22 kDa protein, mitochondrial-like isoform X2 n=1 Tax=Aristolochia californica TaxID=171875 RepID=UPI0035E0FAE1
MASIVVSRRALASSGSLVQKLRSYAAPSAVRSFNTNALRRDEEEPGIDVDRRGGQFPSRRREDYPFFGGVVDPFSPPRTLSQLFNMMDQMMENPLVAVSRGLGGGARRSFDVKEDENALRLRIDMPGLGKDNVKVSVEQNTLVIRGEGEKEAEDENDGEGRYTSRIDLPPRVYKLDQVKAEMKNGVLKVIVPKVKEEEQSDVLHVKVE